MLCSNSKRLDGVSDYSTKHEHEEISKMNNVGTERDLRITIEGEDGAGIAVLCLGVLCVVKVEVWWGVVEMDGKKEFYFRS